MCNRLLLIIVNPNKKLAEYRILSSNELKTKAKDLTIQTCLVIREEYNYSDAYNIPYSDQDMTIQIEHY
jgi:hypothetical protein